MSDYADWDPFTNGIDGDGEIPFPPRGLDVDHVAATGLHHNGLPPVKPYVWRPGDAEREAEIAERLAIIRARLRITDA